MCRGNAGEPPCSPFGELDLQKDSSSNTKTETEPRLDGVELPERLLSGNLSYGKTSPLTVLLFLNRRCWMSGIPFPVTKPSQSHPGTVPAVKGHLTLEDEDLLGARRFKWHMAAGLESDRYERSFVRLALSLAGPAGLNSLSVDDFTLYMQLTEELSKELESVSLEELDGYVSSHKSGTI